MLFLLAMCGAASGPQRPMLFSIFISEAGARARVSMPLV